MKVLGLHPLLFYRDDIAVLASSFTFGNYIEFVPTCEVQKVYNYLIFG